MSLFIPDPFMLKWSEAIAITYFGNIDTLYMYTLLTVPGDVGPHPDGPFVNGNIPQFQLEKTISGTDIVPTRILKKGNE
jgi:hypothetical protein